MKDVIEAGDLPHKDKVYLKKSFGDWRVVYPIKKENGKVDWFVLLTGGSWLVLVKTFVVVLLILALSYSYMKDTAECRDLIENICDYSVNISMACSAKIINNNPLAGLNLDNIGGLNVQKET